MHRTLHPALDVFGVTEDDLTADFEFFGTHGLQFLFVNVRSIRAFQIGHHHPSIS